MCSSCSWAEHVLLIDELFSKKLVSRKSTRFLESVRNWVRDKHHISDKQSAVVLKIYRESTNRTLERITDYIPETNATNLVEEEVVIQAEPPPPLAKYKIGDVIGCDIRGELKPGIVTASSWNSIGKEWSYEVDIVRERSANTASHYRANSIVVEKGIEIPTPKERAKFVMLLMLSASHDAENDFEEVNA